MAADNVGNREYLDLCDSNYEQIEQGKPDTDAATYEKPVPLERSEERVYAKVFKVESPPPRKDVNRFKTVAIVTIVVCILLLCLCGYLAWLVLRGKTDNSAASGFKFRDCYDYRINGYTKSGVYNIVMATNTSEARHADVYCDMDTDGGGWTVLIKREDNDVDFYRTWTEYQEGFGRVTGEHYLGNENMHFLTMKNGRNYMLRVDLTLKDGKETRYATHSVVMVESNEKKYSLVLGSFNGTLPDALTYSNNMKFSASDIGFDTYHSDGLNCSRLLRSGWWYKACCQGVMTSKGIIWNPGGPYPSGDMKIRPV